MSEKKQVELTIGKKLSKEDVQKMDPAKKGVLLSGVPESDVAGQHNCDVYGGLTQCPYCGNIGHSRVHATHYQWYTCGRCGSDFKA